MSDATRYPVPDRPGDPGGGLIVCLGRDPQLGPCRCLVLDPGAEVHFGRSLAHELGATGEMTDVPDDPTLSPRHAVLGQDVSGAYLVDFDSTHGTWLNGERIAPRVAVWLRSGDVFQVGALRYLWLRPTTRVRPLEFEYGALTREAFEQACRTALERARRLSRPLSLVLVGGHGSLPAKPLGRMGDLLAEETARVGLGACLNGRLSADEFAVLLPEVSHETALRLLVRLRRRIARTLGALLEDPVRVGLATVSSDGRPGSFDPLGDAVSFGVDGAHLLLAAARADRDAASWPRC